MYNHQKAVAINLKNNKQKAYKGVIPVCLFSIYIFNIQKQV